MQYMSDSVWDCPRGEAKQCKSGNLDMRWYQDTKPITLNGERKNEIKRKAIFTGIGFETS